MTGGVRRIFLGVTFWPKGIFLGRENNRGIFWVLYFSSAQIKNNMSAIYSFVFEQNQSWSWHVLTFQKIYNKICWCKNTEGFFWVDKFWSWDFLGHKIWTSVGPPVIEICEWGPWDCEGPTGWAWQGYRRWERIRQEVRVLKGLEAGEKGEVTQQCLTFCKYRKRTERAKPQKKSKGWECKWKA